MNRRSHRQRWLTLELLGSFDQSPQETTYARSIPNRPGNTLSLRTVVTWAYRLCPAHTLRKRVPRISCWGGALPLR
jgi:hypothetical protein